MKKTKLILALLALLPFSRALAQNGEIIYVDFDPDWYTQSSFDTLWIDFDGNGSRDLLFYYQLNSAATVRWICTTDESWEIHPMCDTDTLPPYPAISEIENSWLTAMYCITPGHSTPGESKKWAVRHKDGDDYYNGWFNMASSIAVSFDAYAYCTIPNYPLQWGQIDYVGIEENEVHRVAKLHPNPTTGLVTVAGENLKQAEMLNTLGQVVATAQGNGHSLTMDIGHLPADIYFVSITDETGRKCVRKVVKE